MADPLAVGGFKPPPGVDKPDAAFVKLQRTLSMERRDNKRIERKLDFSGIAADDPISLEVDAISSSRGSKSVGFVDTSPRAGAPRKSKTSVMNDVTNTGVMAALVGGFALSNLQAGDFDFELSLYDNVIYVLLVFAVHACTCSALTSAFVYRTVNYLPESEVPAWADSQWMILMMPIAKFAMGTLSYIVSVIFISYRTLEAVAITRAIAVIIGLSSMSTVMMTLVMLNVRRAAAKPMAMQ